MKLTGNFNLIYRTEGRSVVAWVQEWEGKKGKLLGWWKHPIPWQSWWYEYIHLLKLLKLHFKCMHFIIYEWYFSQVSLKVYELSCTQLLISCDLRILSCLSYLLLGLVFTLVTTYPTAIWKPQVHHCLWCITSDGNCV